ncbi:uncharacterized protein J3D65DRAFT_355788 [Phyllosticta citribraziliensis]|uniref:Uncharacterized protein n=1 Tax=Phyllosticta citribraziliensis TaxID=989973 RepID=A0ABR1LNU1_9PEZI
MDSRFLIQIQVLIVSWLIGPSLVVDVMLVMVFGLLVEGALLSLQHSDCIACLGLAPPTHVFLRGVSTLFVSSLFSNWSIASLFCLRCWLVTRRCSPHLSLLSGQSPSPLPTVRRDSLRYPSPLYQVDLTSPSRLRCWLETTAAQTTPSPALSSALSNPSPFFATRRRDHLLFSLKVSLQHSLT